MNNEIKPMHSCAVILAAGAGSRMTTGYPKQLLTLRKRTMLEAIVSEATTSLCSEVIVVLGSRASEIAAATDLSDTTVLNNEQWESGLSTSIRTAVEFVSRGTATTEGILFLTADQPFVSTDIINKLVLSFASKPTSMVACGYGGTIGIPAVFPIEMSDDLMRLQGDSGARTLLMNRQNDVVVIPFEQGEIDVDTLEDYEQAKQLQLTSASYR